MVLLVIVHNQGSPGGLTMHFLLEWQNVIFLIPLAFGCLLVVGAAMGLVGHDADHGYEPNVDADHDVHHDVAHGDHDADHDQESHHALDHHEHDVHAHGLFHRVLGVLGIGRAPLSALLMTAALIFGGVGMAANFILRPILVSGWLYGWISLAIACAVVITGTGTIARIIQRFMPSTETYRISKRDLIGCVGTTLFDVTTAGGYLQVNDAEGNLQQVACRAEAGSIGKGSRVRLVAYEVDGDRFVIESAIVADTEGSGVSQAG